MQPVFVEASTGRLINPAGGDCPYTGVELVWNASNAWICMQVRDTHVLVIGALAAQAGPTHCLGSLQDTVGVLESHACCSKYASHVLTHKSCTSHHVDRMRAMVLHGVLCTPCMWHTLRQAGYLAVLRV
jgi:hypothetical protein